MAAPSIEKARNHHTQRRIPAGAAAPSRLRGLLSPAKVGGVYVWLLIIVIFALWIPDTFLTGATARAVGNNYAVSGIAALAVIVPLLTGVFDISVGYTIGLSGTMSAWLLANTGIPWWGAALAGVGVGAAIGLLNAFVVVVLRIDAIIGTLATGSIISAATVGIAGNHAIVERVGGAFSQNVAGRSIAGFTQPVIYMIVLMVILGLVLEQTKSGRYMYAVGFNAETARLAGVRVTALKTVALVVSGTVAAIGGVALTARIGSSSPGAGPPYLLPAFAAAFLGATQFRSGRFNAWGTVLATLLLGTGQYGLLLAGAPRWSPDVFNGVALIAAVAISVRQGIGPAWLRALSDRFIARRGEPPSDAEVDSPATVVSPSGRST